jgi:hypothetical protein
MIQSTKRNDPPPPAHQCPVCHHPQTKIQRRLNETTRGAINYVCARPDDCSLGINLSNVETWVVV